MASAYLFFGPNAVGKKTLAKDFLQTILCHKPHGTEPCENCASCKAWGQKLHPDSFSLEPLQAGGEISVNSVRTLLKHIRYRPTLSRYRTALISNAESLNQSAANALLKTLEEPPDRTVIVLSTEAQSQIPLTVRSRCQELAFHLVGQEELCQLLLRKTGDAELALNISHCAVGRPGLALRFLSDANEYRAYQDRVRQLLSILSLPIHERLKEFSSLVPTDAAEVREASWPLLDIIIWLLRDAALLRERGEQFLVYRFLTQQLRHFAAMYSTERLLQLVARLGDLKRKLLSNANTTLSFESFLVNI